VILGTVAAVLALIAGGLYVLRLRELRRGGGTLTDDMIERIENTGRLDLDEPLDLEDIREEEERFWEEEPWDEAEEM